MILAAVGHLYFYSDYSCKCAVWHSYARQTSILQFFNSSKTSKNDGLVEFSKRMPSWESVWLQQINPISIFPYRFEDGASHLGGGPRVGIEIIGVLLASSTLPKDILFWSVRCPVWSVYVSPHTFVDCLYNWATRSRIDGVMYQLWFAKIPTGLHEGWRCLAINLRWRIFSLALSTSKSALRQEDLDTLKLTWAALLGSCWTWKVGRKTQFWESCWSTYRMWA